MKTLKKVSKTLNNYFVLILLFVFYFPAIGTAFIFFKIFTLNKKTQDSYWNISKKSNFDKKYFNSPY